MMQPVMRDAIAVVEAGRSRVEDNGVDTYAVWVDDRFVGAIVRARTGKEYHALKRGSSTLKRFGKKHLAEKWLVAMALKDEMVRP